MSENPLYELFYTANRKQTYPKGTVIIQHGGSLEYVYLIANGFVKVTHIDKYGTKRTVAIFSKNHIIPITWLLAEVPQGSIYSFEAMTEVTCYIAPREKTTELLRNNPKICCVLLDVMTKAYLNASSRVHNLQKTNVGERVDFTLYYLAVSYGEPYSKNIVQIDTTLTHQDIADFAGLSRETVSHQLAKPRYSKIFWKEDSKTYVDTSLLDIKSMPRVYGIGSLM